MRAVGVCAWLMILGGLVMGALFLLLIISPPHHRVGSAVTPADSRFMYLTCSYMSATVAVLGAGLRSRLSWAWHGTVGMSFLFALVGLMFPLIGAATKNAKLSGIVVFVILGAMIFIPSLLLFWHLLRRAVRENFEVGEMSTLNPHADGQ